MLLGISPELIGGRGGAYYSSGVCLRHGQAHSCASNRAIPYFLAEAELAVQNYLFFFSEVTLSTKNSACLIVAAAGLHTAGYLPRAQVPGAGRA